MARSTTVESALGGPPSELGARLIALVENQWFERKSARVEGRAIANDLIGFANAEGGVVVVGLHDGKVEGTDRAASHVNGLRQAAMDFSVPPVLARTSAVSCLTDDGAADHLLVFSIEPSDTVHANVKDEVYLRVGDETRRLSFVQRQELVYDKGQATYESRPTAATVSEVDERSLGRYAEALAHPDPHRLLRSRGLASGESLTVAGALLFAKQPQRHLPEAFVRVLRYRGGERGAGSRQQLQDDDRCLGPIPTQLEEARARIRERQPVRRALLASGRFGDVPLIPEDAWLEGLVNAVIHRSYSLAGDHIRVEVFSDRIEISSPGRFPGLVDPSRPLEAQRFARNPRIARVAAELAFGQELGEGIRRIFEEMQLAGLTEPRYRQTSGSVHLTLSGEPADRALEARLPDGSREIIAVLREAGRLSTSEVAEVAGVARPAAIRRLRRLQETGLVEWVGKSPKDPRAYWRLPPT